MKYNLTYNKIQKNNENLKFLYATNLHIICNYIVHFKENYFKKIVLKFLIFKFHDPVDLTQFNLIMIGLDWIKFYNKIIRN